MAIIAVVLVPAGYTENERDASNGQSWWRLHDLALLRSAGLAPDVASFYAVVGSDASGACFLAYASVIDNLSGDPVFILAR